VKNKLISIIVPVYNVEKYIEKCTKSLMIQDYPNIEIILVDDGSVDNSVCIIDQLAKKDTRIIVIRRDHAGVSAARNTALKIAHGEYVMFVDGDDWVDKNYVSYFVELAESNDCEIGFNKSNYYVSESESNEKTYKVSAEKAIEWIYSDKIFVAVWNKIYKTSFLKENKIKFSEDIWYGEGMLFNIECLQYVDNIAVGEKTVYHQTFNPDSAMRSFNLRSNYCGISSLWLQRSKWKKKNKAIENEWQFHKYRFNRTIIDGIVRNGALSENNGVFRECVCNIRKDILIPMKNEKTLKGKLGWICYFISPIIMAKRAEKKYNNALKIAGENI